MTQQPIVSMLWALVILLLLAAMPNLAILIAG